MCRRERYIKCDISRLGLNQQKMSHEQFAEEKKEFRSFVLHLKKLNPSWKPKEFFIFLTFRNCIAYKIIIKMMTNL